MLRRQYVFVALAAALLLPGAAWLGMSQSAAKERGGSAQSVSQDQEAGSSGSSTTAPSVEPAPTARPTSGVAKGKRLATLQRQAAEAAAREKAAAARPEPFSLRISSFNVLGSQHTVRGAQRASMASGTVRARWAADLISGSGADVVGFGELQGDQYSVIRSRASGFAAFPGTTLGNGGIATNVIWRTSRFDLVDASYLRIDFLGQSRPMPIVLLKDKATERMFYVFNVHNSPVQARGSHQGERNVQMAAEIATIKRLRATGRPVFFIGDMNEHAEVFCKVTGATDLTSPAGGSTAGGCRPPAKMRVDWIFGNGTWTHYDMSRSALVRRVTDHTVLFTDVTIP